MEVHHAPNIHHKEKPWKEYLLEGLMIFIAVTLGFFAENIREGITEKNKKQEILEAVANDFEKDIKSIEIYIDLNKNRLKILDSLNTLIQLPPEKIDQQIYYRLIVSLPDAWKFTSNNKSRVVAESKGYFSSKDDNELAKNISQYEFYTYDLEEYLFKVDIASISHFLDNKMANYVQPDLYEISARSPSIKLPSKLGIHKIAAEHIKELRIFIASKRPLLDNLINEMGSMKNNANKAINLIHKKYE
jgi:hypothetical protein